MCVCLAEIYVLFGLRNRNPVCLRRWATLGSQLWWLSFLGQTLTPP